MYQKRNNILEVLCLFLGNYSRQFYLREISRLTGIPLKTTHRVVLTLEKNKILKSDFSGKNKYFKPNLENIQTKLCLLQVEIYKSMVFIDKYPLIKAFLKDFDTNSLILVFGSFAKLQADKNSDLDLLIASREKHELPLHLLSYKAHKIELSEKDFIRAMHNNEPLIKEIAENHIILNNHSFYVNLIWGYYGEKPN